jgi:DNA-binding NarL/FixJ family response regulator
MRGRLHRCDAWFMALRTLIVDDNEQFLDAARRLLEREGLIVVGVAKTSADALERARELRPDVSLVDIDLGEESGFDVARRLDDDDAGIRSSVILISTHAEEDFADLIANSPALGFLSKSRLSARAIREILSTADPGATEPSRSRGT